MPHNCLSDNYFSGSHQFFFSLHRLMYTTEHMIRMATICTFVIGFDVYDDNILINSQDIIIQLFIDERSKCAENDRQYGIFFFFFAISITMMNQCRIAEVQTTHVCALCTTTIHLNWMSFVASHLDCLSNWWIL